jgi:predicted transcriptional regulator
VWPKTLREQVELMRDLLATPQTLDQLAAQFKRRPTKAIQQQLDALVAMGLVTESNEQPGVWQWV